MTSALIAKHIFSCCLVMLVFSFIHHAARYDGEHMPELTLFQKGSMNLTKIGDISYKLNNSLGTWLYSILVIVYRKDKNLNVMDIIRDWSQAGLDAEVTYNVEDAYTKFLCVIDEARQNEVEPVFKVSSEYDYHVLPKILKFNDYVDCESLIERIDATIGGAVNG